MRQVQSINSRTVRCVIFISVIGVCIRQCQITKHLLLYRYKEPIGSGDNKYFRAVPELPSNDVNRLPTIPGQ